MLRPVQVALACLVAAMMVAPAQAQGVNNPNESTPTTLYFHIFDTFNRFVINTQPLDVEFFEVGGTNNPTWNELGWDQNTIYGYSTAGPVEYEFIENGRPRMHPERGIASDVLIDEEGGATAFLYLDVRDVVGLDALPNALPELTFEVTVQEGDDPGRDADYDVGTNIMHGKTTVNVADATVTPTDLPNGAATYLICLAVSCYPKPEDPIPAGPSVSEGNQAIEASGSGYLTPDESGIVEIPVQLDILRDRIPRSEAYNVRIDWYQGEEHFGEDGFSTGYFRLAADQDHIPRLEFNIFNPIYVEFLHPQVAAGSLLIHAGVNSPWGTYDIDTDSIELTVDGPSDPETLKEVVSTNQHVHGLHDEAAQITYLWKFREEQAAEGEYTISIAVQNNGFIDADGNVVPESKRTATATASFVIEGQEAIGFDESGNVVEPTLDGEEVDTPAAGPLAALAMLGVALVLARRRFA